ncbi:MAG: two-component system sensor histidine kinase NtrB, partial [Desulfosalsimonas sp.]
MAFDISERRDAENKLAEQHSLIKAIYRNAPFIMMVVDGDRRLRQVNEFATQFAGRTEEEMLGLQSGKALRCLHAMDDPRGCGFGDFCRDCAIRNKVLESLENGVPNLQVEVPFTYFQADKTQALTLLVSTTPITFQGQNMALVIMMDITERKQAEKEQEKLRAQLNEAQKMESVGRLAGGVAHDFNNMLSIINGYAEMTMDLLDHGEPARKNIQEIYNAGTRSAGIVRQLLAFARQQTISPVQLDLNDTIASLLKMLQRLIGENIDLTWNPGSNLWPVKIDPTQVHQVLANLAVNARDAISDVGKLTIETKNVICDADYCRTYAYFIPGQYVMLAVSDDGCGMEKEIQDNLFEPFFTTKEIG